jgi:hypothetical protein
MKNVVSVRLKSPLVFRHSSGSKDVPKRRLRVRSRSEPRIPRALVASARAAIRSGGTTESLLRLPHPFSEIKGSKGATKTEGGHNDNRVLKLQ